MRFLHRPVTALEDATLNFEQLEAHGIADDTTLGGALAGKLPKPSLSTASLQTFLQLASPATRKLAFGTATVSWPGGTAQSSTTTVTHGLGATPVVAGVLGMTGLSDGSGAGEGAAVSALGGTSFGLGLKADHSPAAATSCTVYWIAIG